MKIHIASTCLVIGTLRVPFAAHAADSAATDTGSRLRIKKED